MSFGTFLGLDDNDTTAVHNFKPEQNNDNLVFLLLHPTHGDVREHRRLGIARFRTIRIRPTTDDA
jgi:hypothetical protein